MPKPTDKAAKAASAAASPSTVPSFELFPSLASSSDFISVMTRLRDAKQKLDAAESEVDGLKLEAGSMIAVAGAKSVAFIDLKITNSDGGTIRGKVHPERLIEQNVALEKIALAATAVDEQKLMGLGVAPHVIAAARDEDKPRAGSTKLEWMKNG